MPSSVNATVTIKQPQLGRQRWTAGRWRFTDFAALLFGTGEPDRAAISAASVDMSPLFCASVRGEIWPVQSAFL